MDLNFAKSKSLLDLPNEILLKIFKYLDLRSALRLRLNKRLDELQSNLHYRLNCDIDLNFLKDDLAILTIAKCGVTERTYNDISILEAGFKRLSHKVGVNRIWITAAQDPNEQQNRILAQLLTFKAEELTLYTFGNLPLITLPPLLALADNISEIDLDAVCNALTAEDLCTIHEIMLNGSCDAYSCQLKVETKQQNHSCKLASARLLIKRLGLKSSQSLVTASISPFEQM